MKVIFEGKYVLEFEKMKVLFFRNSIFSEVIEGSKPILLAPDLENVTLNGRVLYSNGKVVNIVIEELEGFILVKKLTNSDPSVQVAAIKDPTVSNFIKKIQNGYDLFLDSIPEDGETTSMLNYLFINFNWEQIVREVKTALLVSFPDLYCDVVKMIPKTDLGSIKEMMKK